MRGAGTRLEPRPSVVAAASVARPARLALVREVALVLVVAATVVVIWVSDVTPSLRGALLVAVAALAVGARFTFSRLARPARGVVGLAWGAIGVAGGVALGAARLAMTGWSVTAALGIVGLTAGLFLLGDGLVATVRVLPGWWRLLMLPLVYGLGELVVFPLVIGVYATHQPVATFTAARPATAEAVTIPTADGIDLAAWWTPPADDGAVVILRHGSGAGSSKASTVHHADLLVRHGYGVLAMDARGFGESGGRPTALGWYGEPDIVAAVDWLVRRSDVDSDRIAAMGLSMGGEEAVGAAGVDGRIRAVVAEGATGRSGADHDHFGYTGLEAVLDRAVMAVTDATTDLFTQAPRPTPLADAVRAMGGRPVLLITGEPPAEATAAAYLADVAPGTVQVWNVPDAPHTRALAVRYGEWEARVVRFLDAALR